MLKENEYTISMDIFNSIYITNNYEDRKIGNKFEKLVIDNNIIKENEFSYRNTQIQETIQTQKTQKKKILNLIKESETEWGCYSEFEEFLIKNKKDKFLINIINQIFIDNISNRDIIVKILHAFSKLDYEDTYPNAQTMCLAAISVNNSEVKEAAIQVFEAWRNREALKLLKIIDIKENWLKKYCDQVIEEIEEELGNV